MMVVLATWVLFKPITVLEVCKANRTSYYTKVDHIVPVCDHAHLLEHCRVNSLLEQIDSIFSQGSYSSLVPQNIILNVCYRILINFLVHLAHFAVIKLSEQLQH